MRQRLDIEACKRIQLEILDDIDAFCKAEGIRYSLAYGTLIGAVRHKGYIPWDDDIDLIMPRPDYDRFLKEFTSEQNVALDLSHSDNCIETFTKVCRKGTVMVDRYLGRELWGINVDIFPIDGGPETGLESHYEAIDRKKEWIPRLCSFYKVVKKNKVLWFLKYLLKRIRYPYFGSCVSVKAQIEHDLRACPFENAPLASSYYYGVQEFRPREWFESYTTLVFENKTYPVISQYDAYLRCQYGDYMQLPPEEERVSHHDYDSFLED